MLSIPPISRIFLNGEFRDIMQDILADNLCIRYGDVAVAADICRLLLCLCQSNVVQDELADQIGVSRQTLSKYETGESLPDIERCKRLADVFGVTVDDLINYEKKDSLGLEVPPKGKHIFGMVKVGEKGQIVIPAKARKIFDIKPGDNLIVLGDEGQGIALIKEKGLLDLLKAAREEH